MRRTIHGFCGRARSLTVAPCALQRRLRATVSRSVPASRKGRPRASFTVCVRRARRLRIRSISASSPPRAARAPVQAWRGFRASRRAPAPATPERACGPRSRRAPRGLDPWCSPSWTQISGSHTPERRSATISTSRSARSRPTCVLDRPASRQATSIAPAPVGCLQTCFIPPAARP
jgi:hypothetical protein